MRIILKMSRAVVFLGAVALLAAGCSSGGSDGSDDGVSIVATTTMLGDITRNVVGEDGTVEVLLPTGVDPHDFQPSSSQVSAIYAADLVVANGLGLEEGLSDVLAAASADGVNVLEVAGFVDPVSFTSRQPCLDDTSGTCDPHVWLDPERDAHSALVIGEALALLDGSIDWEALAGEYANELRDSDLVVKETLTVLPGPDRILVTNHDSLGYFADRYGFDVIGSVIPGGSTLSEPSSVAIADLVDVINNTGVKAIFAETTESTALADAIASEVEHPVRVILLFTGSLGPPGSGADTLIGMLETNATRIADGLS